MTEITCSYCGAQNPSQSKFCNRCGAPLASDTTHVCPTCGTANPTNLLYCDNCGTRLVDDVSPQQARGDGGEGDAKPGNRSEPFSLPTRPPGQTGNLDVSAELPEWLKTGNFAGDENPGDFETEEPEWLRAAQEGEPWEDEDAPTLEELSGDHAPQDDLPSWLMDEEVAGEIFRGEKSTDELFMASLSADDEDAPRETGSVLRDDLPEWLQGLSAPEEGALLGEELDDIREGDQEDPSPPTGAPDPESTRPELATEPDAATELHDWLSEMEALESAADDVQLPGPIADTNGGVGEAEMSSATDAQREEDDFLQWLSEIQEEAADEAESYGEVRDVPPEPRAPATDQDSRDQDTEYVSGNEPPSGALDADAPDWLINLTDESPNTEIYDQGSTGHEESPDWLLDPAGDDIGQEPFAGFEPQAADRDGETEYGATVDFSEGTVAGDDFQPDSRPEGGLQQDEFLQWLDSLDARDDSREMTGETNNIDLYEEEVEAAEFSDTDFSFSEADFALPEWLGELAQPDQEAAPAEVSEFDELPVWLRDLAPPGGDVSLPYVSDEQLEPAEEPLEHETAESEEAFQDSLSAVGEPEVVDADLPEWLTGVTSELDKLPPEGTELAASEESQEAPAEISFEEPFFDFDDEPAMDVPLDLRDQQVPREDLPSWFSDVLEDIAADDEIGTPVSEPSSEIANVPEQLAGSELPEWLDSPFVDEGAAEPTPLEEIPEWLRAPLKERLARAAEERGLDETLFDSGDEWRELLEAPLPSQEPGAGPVQDHVPAWLASMRSGPGSDAAKAREPDREDDAGAGPVAGIHGTIGVASVVAQTVRRDPLRSPTISKEQEQQVLLLRQLTRFQEDEARVIPSASAAKRSLPLLVRLLLAMLLLASIVVGLFAPEVIFGSETAQLNAAPETLMPQFFAATAGQPVLVVFDYTPAMAGVLQPPAEALLRNLEAQNRLVLATSESPAGLALAHRALENSGATLGVELGFLPGTALGVRRLGYCIGGEAPCQTLFGQPLEAEISDRLAATSGVVVVTGDRDSLLAWLEQLGATQTIPLAAIVTPGLQPVADPYVSTGQLSEIHVATGLSAGDSPSTVGNLGAALALSRWLVALAIAAGAVLYGIRSLIPSRRT